MSRPERSAVNNRLLRAMKEVDFVLIQPHLRIEQTQLRQPLIVANIPIERLYFPEVGYGSVTTLNAGGRIEIGLIGREGLIGAAPVLLHCDSSPQDIFVQAAGEMLSIGAAEIAVATEASLSLRMLLLRYVQTFHMQTAQTAYVNAAHSIEQRLSRWILMCQDRLGGDELPLTHDFLSIMLGVQRTSVTLSLQVLEGTGLIRARRGRVEVRDRQGLMGVAGAGYGVPEAEYARLIGPA